MLNKTVGFFRVNTVWILSILILGILLILISRVIYLKHERKLLIMTDIFEDDDAFDEKEADYIFRTMKMQEENILKTREKIKSINSYQQIFNEYIFAYVMKRTPIIVVQVDRKLKHLKQLLKSMENVAGITRSLIIFSHNYYDENINNLIASIDFAKYIQLYYPYSSQLHPKFFPGDDSTYCNENYKCEASNKRDANSAQTKHHWWWTVNQVFDHMKVTKNYNGYILFLDEKQYVADDILYTYKQLVGKDIRENCPQCEIVCLGCHRPDANQFTPEDGSNVIESFGSTEYNMGIAFNKTVWTKIKRLRSHFCYYNDCDWDSSVRFLASKTPEGKLLMLSTMGPRVFQTETCGDLDREIECKIEERVDEISSFLKQVRKGLFPWNMKTVSGDQNYSIFGIEQGSWEDVRDQELCMFMASKTSLRFVV